MKYFNTKSGSVALISVLVVSAILLILVSSMLETHISISNQFLSDYNDRVGYYDSESCLEEAIRKLEADMNFGGSSILDENGSRCTSTVSGSGNTKDISIMNFNGDYTQQYQGQISITVNGTANNAILLNWDKK
jgi:hypothetical protein